MSHRLALLVLACLLFTGCGGSAHALPRIQQNYGELQWAVVGVTDVPTLDPALASDPTSISLDSLVYGGLVRLDAHLRVRPDGADRWTIGRAGTVYTFHLRPHLRYPDGRAVEATDFVGALRRALGPDEAAGAAAFYLGDIARQGPGNLPSVTAPNAQTVRITLRRAAARFLTELAFPTSFVPDPSLPGRYGPNWTDHAAGFGPYRVVSWSHTRSLVLRRNQYYWGGKPTFLRIKIHLESDHAALAAYRRGALDLISGFPPGEPPSGRSAGLRQIPGLALDYLAFNTNRLPFHRLNARRAFAAIWRPSLVASTLGSSAFAVTGFLPSAFDIHTGGWQAVRRPMGYLTRSHYADPNAFPSVVFAVPRDGGVLPLARELAKRWQSQLGVLVQLRALDPSTYDHILATKAFDLALVRWGADYPDPQDFLGTQLGSSPDNITGWSTAQYNHALFLASSYSPRDPRRSTLFRQAASLASRKIPLLPLDEPALNAIIRPDLREVNLTPLGAIAGKWVGIHFSSR
ncbi:MAG: ABC transporter substrate-binding protein [Chloroflexota bacterium]